MHSIDPSTLDFYTTVEWSLGALALFIFGLAVMLLHLRGAYPKASRYSARLRLAVADTIKTPNTADARFFVAAIGAMFLAVWITFLIVVPAWRAHHW